ncbi:MAG: hypothetical protein J07HQW1_02185 [Haloquadratum walsbyi J07HQW1]|jgi:hypothetical protein|uniref:Uncharacterized protein n=1 Tax=Haloquadratum walsbyi J07HQW1 TaxID=1238424 RepID=U1N669_9EURY|nr:MAG: hypothetical protein J07HQW1_02185 [Haloquadratum walsbyi J07HQW1]
MENTLTDEKYEQTLDIFDEKSEVFDPLDDTQTANLDSVESDSVEHDSVEYAND